MRPLTETEQELLNRLAAVLQPLGRLAVALSGGVDSSLLVAAAAYLLGPENVLAITALAPMVPAADSQDSRAAAQLSGVRHLTFQLPESILESPPFVNNPPDRCYHCKKIIFEKIRSLANEQGFSSLADGTNLDDAAEYRPGRQAIQELGVISPLALASLTKAEIRLLAAALCPDFAGKPAMACLATRIPTGTAVTAAAMRRIDQAEQLLRENGFSMVRVRDHQDLARVEIAASLLTQGINNQTMQKISQILHQAGYRYAALDLDGYRTGSMQTMGKDEPGND